MSREEKKPVIGIIGGIASGKTTVAREFGKLGCEVIEADKLAHEQLEKDEVKENVKEEFGEEVLENGNIDKKKLAEKVFSDPAKIKRLNGIIHPPVLQRTSELIKEYQSRNDVKGIVLDMPLLAEVGWDKNCDFVIFVDADEEIRRKRVRKSGKIDEKSLKNRENLQFLLDKKVSIADYIIENNSGLSELVRQVAGLFSKIKKM